MPKSLINLTTGQQEQAMDITDALLALISFTYVQEEQQLEDLLSHNITVNNTKLTFREL